MEKLKEWHLKVMDDIKLSAKLNEILNEIELEEEVKNEHIQKIITLAKEVDVEITADDIKNYIKLLDKESEKLSDDELEMVAGGKDKSDADDAHTIAEFSKWVKKIHIHCFTADSKISTPSGPKAISAIKVGDEVFSVDSQNKKVVGKVTEVRPVADEEIYKVEFSNGATWFTTSSQWFYCGNDDYACAIDSNGKAAISEDGKTATVVNVTKTGEVQKVYDFIVDGVNVFFVDGIATEGYSED